MKTTVYTVYEKDNNDNYYGEYFDERRDLAIEYFKKRYAILNQELKEWQKEEGVYNCTWFKDNKFVKLYLKIQEVEENEQHIN